ncbi:LOW QUALITY PROTEIN: zinc finger protein 804B [Dermochelys coriacea]|uniref:LOW QUALITY PROTEIN: zinc finger protein 804B n=1 Tax=Dermochelys coriacea TaxID=27794 RepID=UPI001CA8EC51|nr:LOW QUALITY PROTEIN: zinc finger protein 804B [Dermochelys coriacea]
MACYLVISSRHLRNGHYRGIKGVFRGPLCKKGARSPGYAEKEKATAKGLEDVKANFYCELCDKQYHKHQEFDNHINSYDHAHKQRLKDLKHREFARNVASKSWKDEKKQEKALKRLHQLAELRKQSECITGSRPVFKAPGLVVEKQQLQEGIFIDKNGRITAGTKSMVVCEGQSRSRSMLEKQQALTLSRHQSHTERLCSLGNQASQAFSDGTNISHRTGVSFSFSKKAHLKLESSASVFSENTEEAYDGGESPNHKTKQTPDGCQSCTGLHEDTKANVARGLNVPQGQMDIIASSNTAAKAKTLKENEKNSNKELEEIVSAHPSFCKTSFQTQLSNLNLTSSLRETEQEGELNDTEKLLETLISPPSQTSNLCTQQNPYKHSDTMLSDLLTAFPPQHPAEQGYASELHYNPNVVKTETFFESSGTVNGNTEMLPSETVVNEMKPKALPFLHVLSKDGSTALQWPTELLLFTKTAPCISYGCNPLYFDFRLSLNQSDHKERETNTESCSEPPTNLNADENETSGLIEDKQMSTEQDNQSLKPKKTKGSKTHNKAQQKAVSDTEKEMNGSGQKYISHYSNENIPKVPAFLDVSQKDYTRERSLHVRTSRRSLKHHLHSCERTHSGGNKSISFLPCVSRTKKHKATNCDLSYSEEIHENQNNCKSIQNWPRCNSDVSDSGKDSIGSFLSYKSSSQSRYSENEGCGAYTRYWRFSSSQKSSSDRHSSYSNTSISSSTSCVSSSSSHRSSDHSRSHLLFCCKRKNKTDERHKCKHGKHNFISSSDDADEDYLFYSKSQRTRNCTQRNTIKYQRHSRRRGLYHRERSKQSRNTHRHSGRKYSRNRRYHRSKSSSTRHSRSSGGSPSCRRSTVSSSGSFSKETVYYLNKSKEEKEGCYSTEPGKTESTHFDLQNVNCQSKKFHVGFSENSAKDTVGERTSLTARLLLERVQSKKSQEHAHGSEGFSNNCGMELEGHSQSHFASKFPSSVGDIAMLLMPEKALDISENVLRNDETTSLESSAKKDNFEASQTNNVIRTTGTNYDNCLFKDIIQIGIGYQAPSIKRNTAIKEQSDLLISEVQPSIQSCDPVPNDFPGAFPSNRYSVVNSAETKEEVHDVSMNLHRVEGNVNIYCDSAKHKCDETENELEIYRKSISPPLTQQPITFSPDEIDKYRLLQLQAQQHMQKQLLAKHLKVLPATGPSAFSATPAVHSVPSQHHASVTSIHHTLLQRFAVSTSVHPHSSHLSLTNMHPLSESYFTPISLSPLAPTIIPSHPTLLTGRPLHLVSTTPIHPSYLTLPSLPHTAFIPTLFTPHLNAAAAAALQLNPLIHPLFQGQDVTTILALARPSSYLD